MEQIVGYYLQMRNATLAVAESCTGGLLAERITSVSGSSRYFVGGAVVYSNQLKTAFADVPGELIEQHGAVSREVAAALAEGIRQAQRRNFRLGHYRRCRVRTAGLTRSRWDWSSTLWPATQEPKSWNANFPEIANASAASPASRRWIW